MTPEQIAELSHSELKTAMKAAGLSPRCTPFDLSKLPDPAPNGGYHKADIERVLAETLEVDTESWRRELAAHFARCKPSC